MASDRQVMGEDQHSVEQFNFFIVFGNREQTTFHQVEVPNVFVFVY